MSDDDTLEAAAWAEFDRLLDSDTPTRHARLAALAHESPALHALVSALLRADERASGAAGLERGGAAAAVVAEGSAAAAASTLKPGDAVGPWTLERPLGAGGMGEVWLAHRSAPSPRADRLPGVDGPAEAPVALKLLHAHLLQQALPRFVREGRILSALEHEHVARLLDAGLAADGRPWLALEFVDGERIDAACDRRRLDVPARLGLFLQVCEAVAHAHAHLVVHRDLKPSNILVVQTPGGDRVKLLDFGIAKLLEDDDGSRAPDSTRGEITRIGARAFTPEYAAPEQIAGGPVTTATDVHALGVLLYLLLTGRRPFAHAEASLAETERAVLEREPVAASASLRGDAAERRATTPRRLAATLRGDLDTIVGKALEKRPEDRYASVLALADDIRRHLAGRPVAARPGRWAYRAGRWVRRHRVGAAAAAAVVAVTLAGVAGIVLEARIAIAQRERAERMHAFTLSILTEGDPFRRPNADERNPRQLVAAAAGRLDAELGGDAALHAEMLDDLGEVAADLGDVAGGEALLRRALAERRGLFGTDSAPAAQTLRKLARARNMADDHREALALAREALAIFTRLGQGESVEAARAESRVALELGYGSPATPEILGHLEHAQRVFEQRQGHDSADAAYTVLQRGMSMAQSRHDAEAESLLGDAIGRLRKALGPHSPREADALVTLGQVLGRSGRVADAQARVQQAIAIFRERLGPKNAPLVNAFVTLASIREQSRLLDDTLAALDEAEQALPTQTSEGRSNLLHTRARVHARLHHVVEAERDAREAFEGIRRLAGDGNARTWYYQSQWGNTLFEIGRRTEAEARQREARRHVAAILGPKAYQNALIDDDLGDTLSKLPGARRDELIALRRESLALTEAALPQRHPLWATRAMVVAAALIERPGAGPGGPVPIPEADAAQRAEALALLDRVLEVDRALPRQPHEIPVALTLRGRLRWAMGDAAGARSDLGEAASTFEALQPRDEAALRAARAALEATAR